MKKTFWTFSFVSFTLYALVDYSRNILEKYLRMQLANGISNFSSRDYAISSSRCQTVLLAMGITFLLLAVLETAKRKT